MENPEIRPICPITRNKISIAGVTCYGTIYDYDAIKRWLEENDTDPLSNRLCPSKFVLKINLATDDITEIMKRDWNRNSFIPIVNINSKVERIYDKYLSFKRRATGKDVTKDLKDYCERKKRMIVSSDQLWMGFKKEPKEFKGKTWADSKEIQGYHSIDFSTLTFQEKNYKAVRFIDCNFSSCFFVSCDLSRCSFIGCNLSGVIFDHCKFIGEEVSFYKSDCMNVVFIGCSLERVDIWKSVVDGESIKDTLKHRLVEGNITHDLPDNTVIVRVQ